MTEDEGIDADLVAEVGFEPAVSVTGRDTDPRDTTDATDTPATEATDDATPEADADGARPDGPHVARKPRRHAALRRRVGAFAILVAALSCMGGAYATFASSSGAAGSDNAAAINQGKQLYQVSCITCHGANVQGVAGRGPALIGVGGAAVYFQVDTGRMPATGQGANNQRKTPKFNEAQTRALAAYVQSIGGGPAVPVGSVRGSTASIADGGELFRLTCASCHGTTGKGAPLSAGKVAPSLNASTDLQIVTAMLSGPESMPVFSNNELTPAQKKAIVAYIQTMKASNDPGGSGIDRIGPVSEAIVLWVGGIGLLMVAILWIGAKSQ